MAQPCHPPVNFVANGGSGSAFPPPLDDAEPPLTSQEPPFTQIACTTLASECDHPDPISAIDELTAITDTIDVLAAAADSQLATILQELDTVVGTAEHEQAFTDFAGAQPGATSLLGDVASVPVPELGKLALVLPSGQSAITLGGTPEEGGPVKAGSAPYTLHLPIAHAGGAGPAFYADGGQGSNPPFTGFGPMAVEQGPDGLLWYVFHVGINPVHAGTFTGAVEYHVTTTIAGFTGTFHLTKLFQILVE